MTKKYIVIAVVAVLGFVGFYLYKKYNVPPTIDFTKLELYDLDTNKIDFNTFKGKKLIVSFGASWCPNCIDELNTLKKIKEKSLSGIEIICISDEDLETIVKWRKRKEYPFTFLKMNAPFNSAGVFSIPTTYILNTKLQVKDETVGYIAWENESTVEHLKKLME